MKLRQFQASGFRGLEKVDLIFDAGRTFAVVGVNGAGKTSILDGIAVALSRLEARIRTSHGRGREIREDDVRVGSKRLDLRVEVDWQGRSASWHLEKVRWPQVASNGSSYESLGELADGIRARIETNESSSVPLMVFYPVNRSVVEIPLRIRKPHKFDQRAAYEDALSGASADFRRFFEWFRDREDYERERRDEAPGWKDPQLEAVRRSIEALVPGFKRLRVKRQPLRMLVDKDGQELAVNQLSDGEKCLLAMVGDLARRLALANPGLDDPLQGEGVVLIDEIELHLHPAWQRNVVGALEQTFPNCQLILTTHSPAVLGHLDRNCVFLLTRDSAVQVLTTLGQDANRLLEDVFGVPARPPEFESLIAEMFSAIENDRLEQARAKVAELRRIYEDREPELVRAEAYIRRKEILGR
jgi:predicted ATP-binding protein involved in virulence